VPYPAELNDSAAIIHRDGTARDFADMIVRDHRTGEVSLAQCGDGCGSRARRGAAIWVFELEDWRFRRENRPARPPALRPDFRWG
jgi:hypothetical protein